MTQHTTVRIMRTPESDPSISVPQYESLGAAGIDLRANLADGLPLVIPALEYRIVSSGLCFEIPMGFEGQVRPRSGLAAKSAITVLNSPGTIDSDYRGEVKVILLNTSPHKSFVVNHGDRIAQMVFAPIERVRLLEVEELSETGRGEGRFGSTGVS